MSLFLRIVRIVAALALGLSLASCGWDVDPLDSVGASLKKICRSSDNCSTHELDPARRY